MTVAGKTWNIRLVVVCFSALAISLPIAWISLAKLFLSLAFLVEFARRALKMETQSPLQSLRMAQFIPWAIVLMFVSLLWTSADTETALQSVIKHSKLIFILVPVVLIRSWSEARIALMAFAVGQIFLMLSAWLISFGVPLPWATNLGGKNAVFSTYLDQSIILATSAAIFWHLRSANVWPRVFAIACAVSALAIVLLLLEGRTGYVIVMALVGLAAAWQCPARWRKPMYGLAAVMVVACVGWAYLHAQQAPVHNNGAMARDYLEPGSGLTSDAWRLHAWRRSAQAMAAAPIVGTGTGSWKSAIAPFEGERFIAIFGTSPISNPHQEYLLWGVEFGVLGCFALLAFFGMAAMDARQFNPHVTHALWSVLAACALACMFNSVLYDDLIGDYFCITLGLLFSAGLHKPPSAAQATDTPSLPSTAKPHAH
ncbi:MAG: O-antigen ligase family protein [Rhodoferax sp.]|nr:O-antigen ligase family protein [Rhodoferax sp.]